MAVTARWRSKRWEVSPKTIKALEGFSTSYSLKTGDADDGSDAEGRPPVYKRGMELQPLGIETFLSASAGVEVRNEIESWGALVGKSAPLVLGGRRFGPEKLLLTGIEVSEAFIDDLGRMKQAKITIKFIEDAPENAKDKPNGAVQEDATAAGVGASADDKAEMKPFSI